MLRALLLILTLAVSGSAAAADTDADKAHKLWQDAIAYRKSLVSGTVEADLTVRKSPTQDIYERIARHYSTAFDGPKSRTVAVWTVPSGARDTYYVMDDGQSVVVTDRPDLPLRVRQRRQALDDHNLIAARLVGFHKTSVTRLGDKSLDAAEPRLDVFRVTAFNEHQFQDGPAVTVRYARPDGQASCSYVFALNKGPSLASMMSVAAGDSRLETAVDCDIVRWPGGFYPSEVRFRSTLGGQPYQDEVFTVSKAAFNVGLPAGTFTLAGLGLPEGRELIVGDASKVWSGTQVTDAVPAFNAVRATASRWDGLWPCAAAGGGALAVGAVLLIRTLRTGRRG